MELKFAFRNLLKRPFLNIVKMLGLSLALSSIILIILFLKNELTYDRFNQKWNRIYRFTVTDPGHFEGKHFARVYNPDYIPQMARYFPEIENYVRLVPVLGGVVKQNENFISFNQAFQCDSTFFKIFDCELLVGDPNNILDNPGSMVISAGFARKIFGDVSPVGQTITLPAGQYYGKKVDFTIRGIMKDFPQNSHFHPEFIMSPVDKTEFNRWAWTYLLILPNANPQHIITGFKKFAVLQLLSTSGEMKTEAHLQPISEIHLHSDKLREIEPNSNMSVIVTLSLAALVLLFIAITNYVNLNLGMAVFSDNYLKISKVFGSTGWMSMKYYVSEGMIIALASIVMSGFITAFSQRIIWNHFSINLFNGNLAFIFCILAIFFMVCILSGTLLLLRQGIGNVISYLGYRQPWNPNRKGISKGLIVLQYIISIALIIAVIVMHRQTGFALKMGMGTESGNLICFKDVPDDMQQKFEIFKQELLKFNAVESLTAMLDPPGGEANDMFQFTMEDYIKNQTDKEDNKIGILPCDYSFATTFHLKFLSGRNFSEKNEDSEGSGEYIINESAMRRLHFAAPEQITGKTFGLDFNEGGIKIPSGRIIGVVEDFHLSTIKKRVEPLVLFKRKNEWLINYVVSFKPGLQKKGLSDLERFWKEIFPGHPFDYTVVSTIYKNVYKTELLQEGLLSLFTFIALFISSMGLLGMSLLTTQRRTKEIGIRVVNGATIGELLTMLNWYFLKWIMISWLIAIPLAWFAMHKWMENFAYKTSLSWWIFALAGLITVMIALVTVSAQSWKAARTNPVEALRYE
jgi:putative ABC transport system permease protein